jgi:hypothetical protein
MGDTLASEGKRYGFDPKLLEQMLECNAPLKWDQRLRELKVRN